MMMQGIRCKSLRSSIAASVLLYSCFSTEAGLAWFGGSESALPIATMPMAREYKPRALLLSADGLYLSKTSEQRGQTLPGGSSSYSNISIMYAFIEYFLGFGLNYQLHKIGDYQTTHVIGLEGEIILGDFFAEFGYGMTQQSFTDQTLSNRRGLQKSMGIGLRMDSVSFNYLYFELGLRQRTTVYDKQNNAPLKYPLTEVQTQPFLGIGLKI